VLKCCGCCFGDNRLKLSNCSNVYVYESQNSKEVSHSFHPLQVKDVRNDLFRTGPIIIMEPLYCTVNYWGNQLQWAIILINIYQNDIN